MEHQEECCSFGSALRVTTGTGLCLMAQHCLIPTGHLTERPRQAVVHPVVIGRSDATQEEASMVDDVFSALWKSLYFATARTAFS